MCEIDWAALGTWAAVVVALAIAVADKIDAWRRRRAEAKLLKAIIRQEIEALSNALYRVGCELNGCPPAADTVALAQALLADPDAPRRIRTFAPQMDTPSIRHLLAHLPALPSGFLENLEAVVFAATDLGRYLEYSIQPDDDLTRIDWLREKLLAANQAMAALREAESWW